MVETLSVAGLHLPRAGGLGEREACFSGPRRMILRVIDDAFAEL